MKTKAFLIATFVLAVGLYGCNNENTEGINAGGVDPGTPTNMGLTFSFPKSGGETRATGDNNATPVEAALNTVDVYILNANSGIMVKYLELTASDFDQQTSTGNEDVWKAKVNITTTTGDKTVFAGVNLPRTLAHDLQNKSLAFFNEEVHSLAINELVTPTGLAMFSANGVTRNLKPTGDPGYAANNVIAIPVKRLVAKVTVEKAQGMTVNAPGVIGNLTFAINNINKKFYLVPKADGSDPNYLPDTWNALDFVNAANTPGYPLTDQYVAVNAPAATVPEVKALKALYTTENTSVNHWKEEITRVTVRATFVPSKVTQKQGTDFIQVNNPNSDHKDFWSVMLQNGYRDYFLVESEATAYQAANPGSIKSGKYIDGYCYYDMFLNRDGKFNGVLVSSKKWDVFRNDYYRCHITSILAPGRPTEEVENPKTPPETETNIDYKVDIIYWNVIQGDYTLEP